MVQVSIQDVQLLYDYNLFWIGGGRGPKYVGIWVDGKNVRLHRHLVGAKPDEDVDHRNGDILNCKRDNLRITDNTGNMRNKRKVGSRAGFKGVARTAWDTFNAHIRVDGYLVNLGTYRTAEEAAEAYDGAAVLFFGSMAATNRELGLLA